jgi:hypothetical protein
MQYFSLITKNTPNTPVVDEWDDFGDIIDFGF